MGIDGEKNAGLHPNDWVSLKDCIEHHKLTVTTFDAVEKQRPYMMSSLKKPLKLTVHQHTRCMEVLNGYLPCLPTLKEGDKEKCLEHIMTLNCLQKEKGLEDKLLQVTKEAVTALNLAVNCRKVPTGETHEAKKERALELSATEFKVKDFQKASQVVAKSAYELFCQFIKVKKTQIDCIVKDMHKKDPWMDINGEKLDVLKD